MIPLLLLGLVALSTASSSPPADTKIGHWKVADVNGKTCIKMDAQIDLTLSYIKEDDSVGDSVQLPVPANSNTLESSCYEEVDVNGEKIPSQVLQLNFPDNDGWNVRIYFTQSPRLEIPNGDWAIYQVTVDANYATMQDQNLFSGATHNHTYKSKINFDDPPEIATDEAARVGDSFYCPSSQGFTINDDAHNGPTAFIKLQNLQMQAYMETEDFGKKFTCPPDQNEVDIVPIIVAGVLAGLVLFTLIAYFAYRSRLPKDILDTIEPEFEEEEHEHGHHHDDHHKEHNGLNHHDNYGYHEEDHRF